VLRRLALTVILAISLGGCAYQASPVASTPEEECTRFGGRWRPNVGGYGFCDRGGGGA
jgi:hypothetical protein